jgi:hypothetical protein
MSIHLNPNNERTYFDRTIVLGKMGGMRSQAKNFGPENPHL